MKRGRLEGWLGVCVFCLLAACALRSAGAQSPMGMFGFRPGVRAATACATAGGVWRVTGYDTAICTRAPAPLPGLDGEVRVVMCSAGAICFAEVRERSVEPAIAARALDRLRELHGEAIEDDRNRGVIYWRWGDGIAYAMSGPGSRPNTVSVRVVYRTSEWLRRSSAEGDDARGWL